MDFSENKDDEPISETGNERVSANEPFLSETLNLVHEETFGAEKVVSAQGYQAEPKVPFVATTKKID